MPSIWHQRGYFVAVGSFEARYLWELYDLTVKPYLTQKREIRLNEENGECF